MEKNHLPSKIKNAEMIALSVKIQSLLLIKWAIRKSAKKTVRSPTLLQLESMVSKMGHRLVLSLEPAIQS